MVGVMMKFSIVLGTRPEIIKMSPIIRECQRLNLDFFILHTGQHYSYNMDQTFFEQLKLPDANYNLDIGSGSHAEQTGKMLIGIEKILLKEHPDAVLVEGDTNSTLAGALAATKLHIKIGHVEAGLRSYDRKMPEEINRLLVDHCSDFLFAPTKKAKKTLLGEGVEEKKIFVTGNTIVDAVLENFKISKQFKSILEQLDLHKGKYFLATVHRQENVDDENRFLRIVIGLEKVKSKFRIPLIYPIHPRARKRLSEFKIIPKNLKLVEPLNYLSFLQLEGNAKLVLTDSGGIQEETCILKVPCVTLRDNTERPETLDVGSNILAGSNPHEIVEKTQMMLNRSNNWKNPFGKGDAGFKIVDILRKEFE